MLYTKKDFPKAVRPFLQRLECEIESAFFRYAESCRIDGNMEPAYWYKEQQTKTFITMALGNLCAGSVLQEPPVKRSAKGGSKRGRVDYYCKFGKQSFFIEFKQRWMGNAQRGRLPLSGVKRIHGTVRRQISVINRADWGVDYAVGMTLAPIWSNMLKHPDPIPISDERRRTAVKGFKSVRSVDAVSYFGTRVNGKTFVEWKHGQRRKKEDYPGVFILWCVRRF